MTITKAGYEDTHAWVPGLDDGMQDFRVCTSLTLVAWNSVHLAIDPDNSLRDSTTNFAAAIRVVMPSRRTLALETIADDPSNAFWLAIRVFSVSVPVCPSHPDIDLDGRGVRRFPSRSSVHGRLRRYCLRVSR